MSSKYNRMIGYTNPENDKDDPERFVFHKCGYNKNKKPGVLPDYKDKLS